MAAVMSFSKATAIARLRGGPWLPVRHLSSCDPARRIRGRARRDPLNLIKIRPIRLECPSRATRHILELSCYIVAVIPMKSSICFPHSLSQQNLELRIAQRPEKAVGHLPNLTAQHLPNT